MELEIYVIVDADGNYAIGVDEDSANDGCDDLQPSPRRVLKIVLDVALPSVVELSATVPAERVGPLTLTVQ